MTEYTTLLSRQIKKHVKSGEIPDLSEWQAFLQAVNHSYEHYERDHLLGKRSLEISSKELRQMAKRLTARASISRLFVEDIPLRALIPQILLIFCHEFEWDVASFLTMNMESKTARITYTTCLDAFPGADKLVQSWAKMTFSLEDGMEGEIFSTKEPYYTPDIAEKSVLIRKKDAAEFGLKSCLGIPIYCESRQFGIIELFSRKSASLDWELMAIFRDIAVELSVFFENQSIRGRELQWQVDFAKESGMRQIATSVLHNVGNVLNTLNISVTQLSEDFVSSQVNNLMMMSEMIKEHGDHLAEFISSDPKGSQIPNYIITLAEWWKQEREKVKKEFSVVREHIDHIKLIIDAQQRSKSLKNNDERIDLHAFIGELISTKRNEAAACDIEFDNEMEDLPEIVTDKNKLLQIVINIINNAIKAVNENLDKSKRIIVRGTQLKEDVVQIEVIDNGCGIDPVNISKIFTYGFTTGQGGHGFGLHSCSLLAKELGGEISVKNLGLGQGAIFMLTLPVELKGSTNSVA